MQRVNHQAFDEPQRRIGLGPELELLKLVAEELHLLRREFGADGRNGDELDPRAQADVNRRPGCHIPSVTEAPSSAKAPGWASRLALGEVSYCQVSQCAARAQRRGL